MRRRIVRMGHRPKVSVLLAMFVCAACAESVVVDGQRVVVRWDDEFARFQPVIMAREDGRLEQIDPFPTFGALVVEDLPLEDKELARRALVQYCTKRGRAFDTLSFSFRGQPGQHSSGPCLEGLDTTQ